MKCPHCKEEIKCREESTSKFDKFIKIIPMNIFAYTIVVAGILTQINRYFKISWNIQNGSNLNYDMLLMFIPVVFILIYTTLYVNKKVKGGLLIFK